MENKEDKELRIKVNKIGLIVSLAFILYVFYELKHRNISDSFRNRSNEIESTTYFKPKVETKICRVCYETYTGSGYEAFGEEFCSLKCYVDK